MDRSNSDYKVHVFVCTNEKKKECCAQRGAEELRAELKEWTKQNPSWKKRIRVNASGCLDRCSEGIAVAVYPQNQWFLNVRPKDTDELKTVLSKLMIDSETKA